GKGRRSNTRIRERHHLPLVNQHRARREVPDAYVLARHHRDEKSHSVHEGKAVNDSKRIAGKKGCDAGRPTGPRHDAHACEPLARCSPAHRDLEDGVIEEEDRGRRREHEYEPGCVRNERLRETPACVVHEGAHYEPCHREYRADAPIDEKRERTRARSGDRQYDFHAGNTVCDEVRRAVHHSSAASSSAWCSCCKASSNSSSAPSMICWSLYSVRLIRWSVTRPWGKL